MKNYTAGPYKYKVTKDDQGKRYARITDDRGFTIVTFLRDPIDPFDNVEADGKLLAAAPELLEALKMIVKCEINRMNDLEALSKKPPQLYTFSEERVIKAQAAIAKAEGK